MQLKLDGNSEYCGQSTVQYYTVKSSRTREGNTGTALLDYRQCSGVCHDIVMEFDDMDEATGGGGG